MDTTTIQVEKPTKELLNELKPVFDAKTFDDVIVALVKKKTKSRYGKFAVTKISPKKMLENVRDKNDRF